MKRRSVHRTPEGYWPSLKRIGVQIPSEFMLSDGEFASLWQQIDAPGLIRDPQDEHELRYHLKLLVENWKTWSQDRDSDSSPAEARNEIKRLLVRFRKDDRDLLELLLSKGAEEYVGEDLTPWAEDIAGLRSIIGRLKDCLEKEEPSGAEGGSPGNHYGEFAGQVEKILLLYGLSLVDQDRKRKRPLRRKKFLQQLFHLADVEISERTASDVIGKACGPRRHSKGELAMRCMELSQSDEH